VYFVGHQEGKGPPAVTGAMVCPGTMWVTYDALPVSVEGYPVVVLQHL
jgi:hypothetical protein